MFRACRFIWVLSLALVTGCSTIKGWFSDDEFDPREPVEPVSYTHLTLPTTLVV